MPQRTALMSKPTKVVPRTNKRGRCCFRVPISNSVPLLPSSAAFDGQVRHLRRRSRTAARRLLARCAAPRIRCDLSPFLKRQAPHTRAHCEFGWCRRPSRVASPWRRFGGALVDLLRARRALGRASRRRGRCARSTRRCTAPAPLVNPAPSARMRCGQRNRGGDIFNVTARPAPLQLVLID